MAWFSVEDLHNLDKTACSIRPPSCYRRDTVYQGQRGGEREKTGENVYLVKFIHQDIILRSFDLSKDRTFCFELLATMAMVLIFHHLEVETHGLSLYKPLQMCY